MSSLQRARRGAASPPGTAPRRGREGGGMARVFVTGSADGLGLAVGQRLIAEGHEVVLHARSESRAADTLAAAPGAADVLVGELSSARAVESLAEAANTSGRFDAVIHNAGVGG